MRLWKLSRNRIENQFFPLDIHLEVHFSLVVFRGNQNWFPASELFRLFLFFVFLFSMLCSRSSSFGKLDSCIFSKSWWSYSNLNNYSGRWIDRCWERRNICGILMSVIFLLPAPAFNLKSALRLQSLINSPSTQKDGREEFMELTKCSFALRMVQ